jgi:parallel beta-helix repeat protein
MVNGRGNVEEETLQEMIGNFKLEGKSLKVPKRTYEEEIIIDKPISLDGGGEAILQGSGKGKAITINSPFVSIKGMVIRDYCTGIKNNLDYVELVGNKFVNFETGISCVEGEDEVDFEEDEQMAKYALKFPKKRRGIISKNNFSSTSSNPIYLRGKTGWRVENQSGVDAILNHSGDPGIELDDCTDCEVTNNVVEGCKFGVLLSGTSRVNRVWNNQCKNNIRKDYRAFKKTSQNEFTENGYRTFRISGNGNWFPLKPPDQTNGNNVI